MPTNDAARRSRSTPRAPVYFASPAERHERGETEKIVKGSDEDQGIGDHAHPTILYETPADHLLPRHRQGDRALITTKFSWSRVSAALGVLILIFFAGVYTAHDPAMKDWSTPLLTTFTGLLGGLAGIIVGEKTAAPDIPKLLLGSSSPPRS